jgi:hypothetical protein
LGGIRRDLRNHRLDVVLADDLLALRGRQELLRRTGLVDDVDRLVRQEAVGDVACGELRGHAQRLVRVAQTVVILEARLQALENLVGVVGGGLEHVDLLETTAQRLVLVEDAAVLLEGGGADAAQLARTQQRLEQVGLASMTPPEAAPAPMIVWISSMNRIAPSRRFSSARRPFRRFSKSPRYLVPASSAPRSSA